MSIVVKLHTLKEQPVELRMSYTEAADLEAMMVEVNGTIKYPPNWKNLAQDLVLEISAARKGLRG